MAQIVSDICSTLHHYSQWQRTQSDVLPVTLNSVDKRTMNNTALSTVSRRLCRRKKTRQLRYLSFSISPCLLTTFKIHGIDKNVFKLGKIQCEQGDKYIYNSLIFITLEHHLLTNSTRHERKLYSQKVQQNRHFC